MKKNIIVFISIVVVLVVSIFAIIYLMTQNNSDNIPDDYIAVFHGGTGEITYSTYIYKKNTGNANYGFKYINTTNTTKSWESTKQEIKITKRGEFDWTDGAFVVAKENNAYDYVKLPNSEETYSINKFKSMFLMD